MKVEVKLPRRPRALRELGGGANKGKWVGKMKTINVHYVLV